MRRLIAAAAAGLMLAVGACSAADPDPGAATDPEASAAGILDGYGLAGMDTREVIDHLDRLSLEERPTDLLASVRADELLLSDGAQELALEIPDDQFYVSVAPYVEQTHDCFFHSLTTCRGELSGEPVHVRVVDDSTGEVLVDEARTTFDNGFVGLWLPRDLRGTLEITHDGRTGSVGLSTTPDAATCLTTLHLAG